MNTARILRSLDGEESGGGDGDWVTIARSELETLRGSSRGADSLQELEKIHSRVLAERELKIEEWRSACKNALRDRELAVALAGKPLVPGAAKQLIKLWGDQFDVHEDQGELKVSTRDGRDASRAVDEWLSSSDYAHFRQASSRGGTATTTSAGVSAPPPATPKTLGESLVRQWRENTSRAAAESSAPIGLGRRKGR